MENRRKIFLTFEQILLVSIFQYIFFNFFHTKITPSFFLVYLLLLSFEGKIELALFLSFILGLINDIFARDIPGSSSIRFLLIVYFSSFFVVKSIKSKSFFIFIFSFLYFLLLVFKGKNEMLWEGFTLLKYAVLFSLFNFLIGFVIGIFTEELRKRWEERIF
ncbi:MAG: hypothetical protein NC926_02150 [Candidatus Omnitrophica bacterium]|nr:hypothetical protein [Candidatus Omnitrophota bacterium]MCM8806750.1 hypothetical protein [Candidatus Omnitrophota bacterium]